MYWIINYIELNENEKGALQSIIFETPYGLFKTEILKIGYVFDLTLNYVLLAILTALN